MNIKQGKLVLRNLFVFLVMAGCSCDGDGGNGNVTPTSKCSGDNVHSISNNFTYGVKVEPLFNPKSQGDYYEGYFGAEFCNDDIAPQQFYYCVFMNPDEVQPFPAYGIDFSGGSCMVDFVNHSNVKYRKFIGCFQIDVPGAKQGVDGNMEEGHYKLQQELFTATYSWWDKVTFEQSIHFVEPFGCDVNFSNDMKLLMPSQIFGSDIDQFEASFNPLDLSPPDVQIVAIDEIEEDEFLNKPEFISIAHKDSYSQTNSFLNIKAFTRGNGAKPASAYLKYRHVDRRDQSWNKVPFAKKEIANIRFLPEVIDFEHDLMNLPHSTVIEYQVELWDVKLGYSESPIVRVYLEDSLPKPVSPDARVNNTVESCVLGICKTADVGILNLNENGDFGKINIGSIDMNNNFRNNSPMHGIEQEYKDLELQFQDEVDFENSSLQTVPVVVSGRLEYKLLGIACDEIKKIYDGIFDVCDHSFAFDFETALKVRASIVVLEDGTEKKQVVIVDDVKLDGDAIVLSLDVVASNLSQAECEGFPAWTVKSYSGGNKVRHRGKVYTCKDWPASGWCGSVGYEPGASLYWRNAWVEEASCSSTTSSCEGLNSWQQTQYNAGDQIHVGAKIYQCKDWPVSGWCGLVGYEPEKDLYWEQAWSLVGSCE